MSKVPPIHQKAVAFITTRLSFLTRDYGFSLQGAEAYGRESVVRYRTDHIALHVMTEMGQEPYIVVLTFGADGKVGTHALHLLLRRFKPDVERQLKKDQKDLPPLASFAKMADVLETELSGLLTLARKSHQPSATTPGDGHP